MTKLLVVLALLMPSVAAADWTFKAPNNQGTAGRILEGKGIRVYMQVRVGRTAKGELHALQVRCGTLPTRDVCKQAMSTIKLSAR